MDECKPLPLRFTLVSRGHAAHSATMESSVTRTFQYSPISVMHGLTCNACHVILHSGNPRFLSQMTSYDVVSNIC